MKLAIMQPYFMPYLGYFQLMAKADRFILLDDVNFISRGWINRNRLLIRGEPFLFTLPLNNASQHRRITDLTLCETVPWRRKLLRTIDQAYRTAPFHDQIQPVLEQIIATPSDNLAEFIARSLQALQTYLRLDCTFGSTSCEHPDRSLSGQDRIIDICLREQARTYLNLPGGRLLYQAATFERQHVDLRFLENRLQPYRQFGTAFVPNLSIIDVLMFNGREETRALIDSAEFS